MDKKYDYYATLEIGKQRFFKGAKNWPQESIHSNHIRRTVQKGADAELA